jgi:hypothetical protein
MVEVAAMATVTVVAVAWAEEAHEVEATKATEAEMAWNLAAGATEAGAVEVATTRGPEEMTTVEVMADPLAGAEDRRDRTVDITVAVEATNKEGEEAATVIGMTILTLGPLSDPERLVRLVEAHLWSAHGAQAIKVAPKEQFATFATFVSR